MPQVVKPELPQPSLFEGWLHIARTDIVGANGSSRFRWEDKIIGNTRFAKLKGAEQGIFFMRHQDRSKLLAHVHAAALMGFGCAEVPHVVVSLHQDKSVFIVFGLSKLNVTPLQRNQFALTQSGPQSGEK